MVSCSSLVSEFFSQYYRDNQFVSYCETDLIAFVITNHTLEWLDKEKVNENMKDITYNYFGGLHYLGEDNLPKNEISNSYRYWWKQEYLKVNHFEILDEKLNKYELCSICLDILNDKDCVKTNCGHIFHSECLNSWNKTKELPNKHSCPLCRTENKKWFPFEKRVHKEKNLNMKFCSRTFRNGGSFHKCNAFFLENKETKFNVCWSCKWESYEKKIEDSYISLLPNGDYHSDYNSSSDSESEGEFETHLQEITIEELYPTFTNEDNI